MNSINLYDIPRLASMPSGYDRIRLLYFTGPKNRLAGVKPSPEIVLCDSTISKLVEEQVTREHKFLEEVITELKLDPEDMDVYLKKIPGITATTLAYFGVKYMSTLEKIKTERITAMKSGQTTRRDTLALILAAIKQVEVDTRKELTETEVIQLLTKMVKQRQESIVQYENAGREELKAIEVAEVAIIEEFLPQQLTETEVIVIITEAIAEVGASSIKDMGKVINILRPKLTGRFDMAKVSATVKALLGG